MANVDAIITAVGANESAILNYAFASCHRKEVMPHQKTESAEKERTFFTQSKNKKAIHTGCLFCSAENLN